MKKPEKELKAHEVPISLKDFLESFNKNMPAQFPKVTEAELLKFKQEHEAFFKDGDSWSLDRHRKKIIDWLPRHGNQSK